MIPDWFAAIDHAKSILKKSGTIAIVDFYVARKYSGRHSWFTRTLWPIWFANDNVNLSPDHLPYLKHNFEETVTYERMGSIPYIPLLKTPHYIYVGRKIQG